MQNAGLCNRLRSAASAVASRASAEHRLAAARVLLKLIAEIALMALAGQWVLGLLAGARRDGNFFYRVCRS